MKMLRLSDPSHGWIDITFGVPPDDYTLLGASDVPNDCLHELADATVRLLHGSQVQSVHFSLEPDFAICRLVRDTDMVRLTLCLPSEDTPVFESSFPLMAFARRLRFELLRIKERYAADDGWTQVFPEREVAALAI
jgi:hypothetical protein